MVNIDYRSVNNGDRFFEFELSFRANSSSFRRFTVDLPIPLVAENRFTILKANPARGDRVQLRWKEAGGERQPPGAGGRRRGPLARPLLAARRAPASGRFGWGVWWLVGNQCRRCGVMNGTDASWCLVSTAPKSCAPFPFPVLSR